MVLSAPLPGEEGAVKVFITAFISQKSDTISLGNMAISLVT